MEDHQDFAKLKKKDLPASAITKINATYLLPDDFAVLEILFKLVFSVLHTIPFKPPPSLS